MIASVSGLVESVGDEFIVVNVGGVGLQIHVPASTLSEIETGQRVRLHTHLHFKEDVIALYGFLVADELKLFQLLTTVSGIGPKTGLKMLSVLRPNALVTAIANDDADTLVRIPGIGRKTAARLSLELKNVLQKEWAVAPGTQATPVDTDAVAALTALGYSPAEARGALASIPNGARLPLEEKLALALQRMGRP